MIEFHARPVLADGSIYNLTGFVLANPIATKWQLDDRFEPFTAGCRWLPYTGAPHSCE